MIDWKKATKEETLIAIEIARRAAREGVKRDIGLISMDIEACHVSGCKLDLQRLLAFPLGDFLHDVCGIIRHINRGTGALEDCFLPRCTM